MKHNQAELINENVNAALCVNITEQNGDKSNFNGSFERY